MKSVSVKIPSVAAYNYPIFIKTNALQKLATYLKRNHNSTTVVIITDNKVKKLYGDWLRDHLKQMHHKILLLSFPSGEKFKTQQILQAIMTKMLRHNCSRDTLILALGGGVVGDLAGFIAATYMRGIAYIQIPTTLLSMVDSSIGGKTGIDTLYGKNLVGAFWQPKAVFADINCLKTLPQKHLINGLIEALKMFMTNDINSLKYAKKNLGKILAGDEKTLTALIQRAIKIKANIVSQDEKENHLRAILNFGHTIGHAIELVANYKILHGYAVALGILVEAKIAELLNILKKENYLFIEQLLFALNISGKQLRAFDPNKIIQATKIDKKVKHNEVHYVLLKNFGEVYQKNGAYSHTVPDQIVKQAFLTVCGGKYGR